MNLFLTSSPCDDAAAQGISLPCILNVKNGFVEQLTSAWKPDAQLVIVCADPHNAPLNDEMLETFSNAFTYHKLSVGSATMLDARNEMDASSILAIADVVLLAGGHVPTQLMFFEQIGLRALMRSFTGTVIGVSAGSMNCAKTVYAQPELPGESIDPEFVRFPRGLGLTEIMIIPHLQKIRNTVLDGKKLIDEITFADSIGRSFLAIPDGSYVLVCDGHATLYGEGWRICNEQMVQICRDGETLKLHTA